MQKYNYLLELQTPFENIIFLIVISHIFNKNSFQDVFKSDKYTIFYVLTCLYESKSNSKTDCLEFGVSISTVSKALSDSPEISEATKIKIQEYATLQNYKPNSIAKNLKISVQIQWGNHTNILNPFLQKVFSGIEKRSFVKRV